MQLDESATHETREPNLCTPHLHPPTELDYGAEPRALRNWAATVRSLSNFTLQLISISDSTQTKLCIGLQFYENARSLLSKWNRLFNRRVFNKESK